jgi:hypothetical protein
MAAGGAAKLAKSLKSKNPKKRAAARKVVPAVRAAAEGRISSKQLAQKARRAGVAPKVANDAATFKRMSIDAQTNPQAAAAVALSKDLTSTQPLAQAQAVENLEASNYHQPTTSRDDGGGFEGTESFEPPPDASAESPDTQAPMTADSVGPDAVDAFEVDDGAPPPDLDEGAEESATEPVSGYDDWN